jgi:hypothetical protein
LFDKVQSIREQIACCHFESRKRWCGENWLEMKKSSIEGAGFGVFALHDFSPKEFITIYLGEKIDFTYMYKDLMSLPNISMNNGFQEEYWLGHRMNHCSSRKKNVETRDNYILHATKKIKAGDELFWDYNHDTIHM